MKLSEQIWKKNTFVVDISIHYTYIYHNNIIYQEPFNLQLREAFIKKTIFLLTFVNKRGGGLERASSIKKTIAKIP